MSTHSRPTSSSSPTRSPLPEPPSCSSSSSSSSFFFFSSSSSSTSSSNKVITVGAVKAAAPRMEKVRNDDAGNASDQSVSRK